MKSICILFIFGFRSAAYGIHYGDAYLSNYTTGTDWIEISLMPEPFYDNSTCSLDYCAFFLNYACDSNAVTSNNSQCPLKLLFQELTINTSLYLSIGFSDDPSERVFNFNGDFCAGEIQLDSEITFAASTTNISTKDENLEILNKAELQLGYLPWFYSAQSAVYNLTPATSYDLTIGSRSNFSYCYIGYARFFTACTAPIIPDVELLVYDQGILQFNVLQNRSHYDSMTAELFPSDAPSLSSSGYFLGLKPRTLYQVTVTVEIGSRTDCSSNDPTDLIAVQQLTAVTHTSCCPETTTFDQSECKDSSVENSCNDQCSDDSSIGWAVVVTALTVLLIVSITANVFFIFRTVKIGRKKASESHEMEKTKTEYIGPYTSTASAPVGNSTSNANANVYDHAYEYDQFRNLTTQQNHYYADPSSNN